MQYQIPQDIEVADKIIGPLTLKQFMYLISGAGFGIGVYAALRNTVIPIAIIVVLSIVPVGIFAVIAFMKVNGRQIDSYIAPFFSFMGAAKKRFWQREKLQINQEEELQKLREEAERKKAIIPTRARREVDEDIASLANIVDTASRPNTTKEPKTVFDIDEERGAKLSNLLKEKAASTQDGREQLVSQMASIPPNVRPETIDQEIPQVNLEDKIQTEEIHGKEK